MASSWPGTSVENSAYPSSAIGWRSFFKDERLQRLIELALANNRDLRIAILNVEQLRAQYRVYNNALLPSFTGKGGATFQRDVSSSGNYTSTRKYSVGAEASYELDFFGRIRSLKAQALEQYLTTEEASRSAQIILIGQVAVQYLTERMMTEEVLLSRRTLKAAKARYRLIKGSYDLGSATELDLRLAETQVQTARINMAAYQRQQLQAENALVLLIGQPLPTDLPQPRSLTSQQLMAMVPGIPSYVLVNRPDVLQAEHQLKLANANIGAVRAAFFPKIALTAFDGTGSVQLAKLFTPGSQVWNFSPQITIPIFNRENNLANLKAAHIAKSIEIARYEKAIQNAFREVSDALSAVTTFNEQVRAQKNLALAQQQRYRLADQRYRNGADSYLAVLTAQQDLYTARQNLIQVEFSRLSNLVAFYKALGNGGREGY